MSTLTSCMAIGYTLSTVSTAKYLLIILQKEIVGDEHIDNIIMLQSKQDLRISAAQP